MGYDKHQVAQEFTQLERELRPKHPSVAAFRAVAPRPDQAESARRPGNEPIKMLDVGCGTGLFASKLRTRLPRVEVCGVDLVSDMLAKGQTALATASRTCLAGTGRQRTSAVRFGIIRYRDLRQQLSSLPASGSRGRRDAAACLRPGRATDDHRRIPRRVMGLVHL